MPEAGRRGRVAGAGGTCGTFGPFPALWRLRIHIFRGPHDFGSA